jgi:hypothetical protein
VLRPGGLLAILAAQVGWIEIAGLGGFLLEPLLLFDFVRVFLRLVGDAADPLDSGLIGIIPAGSIPFTALGESGLGLVWDLELFLLVGLVDVERLVAVGRSGARAITPWPVRRVVPVPPPAAPSASSHLTQADRARGMGSPDIFEARRCPPARCG